MPFLSQKQIATISFLFVAFLMLLLQPAHAGGRYCKVDHYHSGSGDEARSQALAKRSAARAWASFTAWEYGNHWANISISMDRKYSCNHATTGWTCTVMAKPCKSDSRSATKTVAKKKRVYRKKTRSTYKKRRVTRKTRRTRTKTRRAKAKKWKMTW